MEYSAPRSDNHPDSHCHKSGRAELYVNQLLVTSYKLRVGHASKE